MGDTKEGPGEAEREGRKKKKKGKTQEAGNKPQGEGKLRALGAMLGRNRGALYFFLKVLPENTQEIGSIYSRRTPRQAYWSVLKKKLTGTKIPTHCPSLLIGERERKKE